MDSWLIPLAGLLLGGGGVGAILGFVVQRQGQKATATAAAVGHAIDGLTKLTQEQRAELDRLGDLVEAKDTRIRTLENARRRQRRADKE